MESVTSTKDLVGKRIRVRLMGFPEELVGSGTGVYHPTDWIIAKLTGCDDLGIWLENPNLTDFDEQQRNVPKRGWVLFRWQFVASMACIDSNEDVQGKRSLGFQTPTAIS
jgi:hypothetical protein